MSKAATWLEANKNWIIIAILILITAIVVASIMADDGVERTESKLLPSNVGGNVDPQWSAASVTARLFTDAIDGYTYDPPREIAFAIFNQLNDNQKIMVYNWWLTHYADKRSYGQKHGTLTYAIRNEWWKNDEGVKALGNLQRLGLP